MGLRDILPGEGVDYWQLRYREFGSDGWEIPDVGDDELNPKRIDTKLPKEDVKNRAEFEAWPDGVYQLIGRKQNAGYTSSVWTFEIGEEDPDQSADAELTEEERLEQAVERGIRRAKEEAAISSPSEARGEVFARALEGDLDAANLDKLGSFLTEWEKAQQSPPETAHEAAGHLYSVQAATGNIEGATAVLQEWLAADEREQSLVELVQDSGGFDVDMGTIKAMGMLKFIDSPEDMTRGVTKGALEAVEAHGVTDGTDLSGLSDLLPSRGVDEDATGETTEKTGEPVESSLQPTGAGEPADIVAEPGATPDDADIDAAEAGEEATNESAEAEAEPATSATPDADESDAETASPRTVSEVQRELEAEADPEAGQYPNAKEAMDRLTEAEPDSEADE